MHRRFKYAWAIAVLVVLPDIVISASAPSGCTGSDDGWFSCDYAGMTQAADRPIDFADFSPAPLALNVYVNGLLPPIGDSQMFSPTFSTLDPASLDPNYHASLTLDCGQFGSIVMYAGVFANMSYIEKLKVRNCMTYVVPANVFQEFSSVDMFSFEGGAIDEVDPNAMAGLEVKPLRAGTHRPPRPQGRFKLLYTRFLAQAMPPGFLFNWKDLQHVSLVGADLKSINGDLFTFNIRLKTIDISDNHFASIPEVLFDGLESLAEVRMANIPWECTCDNAWFVAGALEKNISLRGDFQCADQEMTVAKYYYTNCVEVDMCKGTIGIALLEKCFTMITLLVYGLALVSLVLCAVSLGLIICTLKARSGTGQVRSRVRKGNKVVDLKVKSKSK